MGRTTDAQRREFLRESLAIGAALTFAARTAPARHASLRAPAGRTIVIGAGLAGLACAHELARAGADVLVLEARGRVGGRVLSLSDAVPGAPGRMVEAGGEFIGANHPRWVAYAREFGLPLLEVPDEPGGVVVLGGRRLTERESASLYAEMERALLALTDRARGIDPDAPWAGEGAEGADHETVAGWVAGLECSDDCRTALRAQFETDNGVAPERQSMLACLAMIRGGGLERFWTESETHRCEGGARRLAESFARSLGAERLRVRASAARVAMREDGGAVTLASGETLEAGAVVLALPPSVWVEVPFEPALPASLVGQMGSACKWLAGVRTRFWRDAGRAADALTDGPIPMAWEATSCERAQENLALTAFFGGGPSDAAAGADATARERTLRAAMEALHPGFAGAMTGSRFIDWPNDSRTRGGYSFPAPGQVCAIGPALRDGVGRVRFAGEHCSAAFPGYMEGALESGVRAARAIGELG